jgi:hypothetical protein
VSKAIIVADLKYKSPKRRGRGTGHKGLHSTLKYVQYVRQEARVSQGQTARS